MSLEEVMRTTAGLLRDTEASAAVGAYLTLAATPTDPLVREHLNRVVEVLGIRAACDALDARERATVVGFTSAFLRLAIDLIDDPARPGQWTHTDPAILTGIGNGSAGLAPIMAKCGLGKPDARILDVGSGIGGLSMSFARSYPESTVVGLEPWDPSIAIARANVEASGLAARITFVQQVLEDYEDAEGFDLVWLPGPFLPEAILEAALARSYELTRPRGEAVLGTFGQTGDPLDDALSELRTVRSGGTLLEPDDAIARLTRAGFADVHEIKRTWAMPAGFVVGTRR
jgi:SAM-dependent methyltransferase